MCALYLQDKAQSDKRPHAERKEEILKYVLEKWNVSRHDPEPVPPSIAIFHMS
jgi:hypothetical protein